MKKVIVSTSIYEPGEAIRAFDAMEDWTLVVAGDKKSPQNYSLNKGVYLSPDEQEKMDAELSEAIGWNCIQRRNFGFIYAVKVLKADLIAVVDDDNIPGPEWGKNICVGKETRVNYFKTEEGVFDPMSVTAYKHLWHRGFPLQALRGRNKWVKEEETVKPMIQADFWNGDPDIDAICRIEHSPDCDFDPSVFPVASNAIAPFNSQNTFIDASLFGEYFLFPFVGRMDDIWAAYYIQSLGNKVLFNKASVTHKRHQHDFIVDMKGEYLGYEKNWELINALKEDPGRIMEFLPERTIKAWELYKRHFS